jgi:hypothetical protein
MRHRGADLRHTTIGLEQALPWPVLLGGSGVSSMATAGPRWGGSGSIDVLQNRLAGEGAGA